MYRLTPYLLAATLLGGCAEFSKKAAEILPINEPAGIGILECTKGDSRYRIDLNKSKMLRKFPLDQNGAKATLFVENRGERIFFGEYDPSIEPDTKGPGYYDLGMNCKKVNATAK